MQTFFLCDHIDAFSKAVTVYTEQESESLLKQYAAMADIEMRKTNKSIFYALIRRKNGKLEQADFFIVPINEEDKAQIEEYYGVKTNQLHYIRHLVQ